MWLAPPRLSTRSWTRRVFPIPASPVSTTTCGVAGPGALPSGHKDRALLIAPDERPDARRRGLQPARCSALAQDAERGDWTREPLERELAERLVLEVPLHEGARRVADDDGVGRGQLLKASGEVGSLAEREPLLPVTRAHLADHDQPGVDAHADGDAEARGIDRTEIPSAARTARCASSS